MMNDGHSWIVDIDLAKFFDTVDHDKLMTIFGRTIKDGDVISAAGDLYYASAVPSAGSGADRRCRSSASSARVMPPCGFRLESV